MMPMEGMKKSFSEKDTAFMRLALEEAQKAAAAGDVPVGAVLVRRGADGSEQIQVIAAGHNTREAAHTALGHAEINVIAQGCEALSSWRLSDCTLYVTLEPCPMCAGSILASRIPRVVCGAKDPVAGAMGSVWAIHRHPIRTQAISVEYGCLEAECRAVLQTFFQKRRGCAACIERNGDEHDF